MVLIKVVLKYIFVKLQDLENRLNSDFSMLAYQIFQARLPLIYGSQGMGSFLIIVVKLSSFKGIDVGNLQNFEYIIWIA